MPKLPSAIAIIPARGGSQRVPGKNLLPLAGLPLLAHSILQAKRARCVREVYVSTDDREIAAVAKEYGAETVKRPASLATAQAPSEAALLHVLDARRKRGLTDPEYVVFLQCTSPVREQDDIDNAFRQLLHERADSIFSACRDLGLFWTLGKDGPHPINYDYRTRKMEQARKHHYRENGSIFIVRTAILRKERCRLGGKISLYEMPLHSSFEINDPADVPLITWTMARLPPPPLARVDLLILDFDGVLTDNSVRVRRNGAEEVTCSRADSLGLARLRETHLPVMVLSTEENPVVSVRCAKLKLPCFHGIGDKAAWLRRYAAKEHIDLHHVAFVGNDENDLACLRTVGVPIAVADAVPSVKEVACWVTPHRGGRGAVRDVCDALMCRCSASGPVSRP